MPKKPKLTVKEAKFVEAKAKGLSNTKAAMIATGTKSVNSAKTLGHRLSTKVNVQEALEHVLAKHEVTLDKAIKPIAEALEAEKVVIVGKGDDAFADVTPDHGVRLQASDRALRLLGVSAPEAGTVNYNFISIAKDHKDKYGI